MPCPHHKHTHVASARVRAMLIGCALALVAGACAGARASSTADSAARANATTPSAATKMICAGDARHEIEAEVGARTSQPVVGRWREPRYGCAYVYGNGRLTLAVAQLRDDVGARSYYESLAGRLGHGRSLTGLGRAANVTAAGPVIVLKDNAVLTVDPRGLPARFGTPPDTRSDVAITVASIIMGCWTES